MTNIIAVLIVRCTHTGVYADGRPNTASVTIYDLDEITIQKNRTRYVPVPPKSSVDIPMSTRTFVSWHEGSIRKLVQEGLLRTEIILQLRDRDNCGGPTGTGQALRPGVPNVERVGNVLRLVIPNVNPPVNVDSSGFLVGEPVMITGLDGAFRPLNARYVISTVTMATGLAGADAGSYLVEVPSVGPDIPVVVHPVGVNLCLIEGRVTVQFTSDGNLSGFGPNIFGYVAGQLLPSTGGGGGTITVEDEGVLVDPAVSLLNFVGAGVTAASTGPGTVDITIPGGGGGAPADAQYVVMALNGALSDERVLTAGTGISIIDGGPNGSVTISVTATLAQVLVNGNTTSGSDIIISTGDRIVGETDLVLDPGPGVGDQVVLGGLRWPAADGGAGDVLTTDGAGNLVFAPVGSVETFISGEPLSIGDLIALDTAGEAILANSSIGSSNFEVIGISTQNVLAGVPVQVITRSGSVASVNFTAAPPAASNGSLVFLSTSSGLANVTPPPLMGNAFFTVGTLQGADGISMNPAVVFRPQLIALRF